MYTIIILLIILILFYIYFKKTNESFSVSSFNFGKTLLRRTSNNIPYDNNYYNTSQGYDIDNIF